MINFSEQLGAGRFSGGFNLLAEGAVRQSSTVAHTGVTLGTVAHILAAPELEMVPAIPVLSPSGPIT